MQIVYAMVSILKPYSIQHRLGQHRPYVDGCTGFESNLSTHLSHFNVFVL